LAVFPQPRGANLLFFLVPGCMFVFGCITIAQGLVRSYYGLLAARFFLGLLEANIFPGCLYLISMYVSHLSCQRYNSPKHLE